MLPSSTDLQSKMTAQINTPSLRVTQKSREQTKHLNLPSYMTNGNFYKPEWHLGGSYLYLYTGVSGVATFHAFPLSEIYGTGVTVTPTAGFTASGNRGLYRTGPYHIYDTGTELLLYEGWPAWNPSALGKTRGTAFGLSYGILIREASYDLSTVTGGSLLAVNGSVVFGGCIIGPVLDAYDIPMHSPIEDIIRHNNTVYVVENNNVNDVFREMSRFNHEVKYITGTSLTTTGVTIFGFIQNRTYGAWSSGDQSQVFGRYDDYPTSLNLIKKDGALYLHYMGVSSTIFDDIEGNVRFESYIDTFRLTNYLETSDRTRVYSENYEYIYPGANAAGDYERVRMTPVVSGNAEQVSTSRPVKRSYTTDEQSRLDTSENTFRDEVWVGNHKHFINDVVGTGNRRLHSYAHFGTTSKLFASMDASGGGITLSVTTYTGTTPLDVIDYSNSSNDLYNLSVSNVN